MCVRIETTGAGGGSPCLNAPDGVDVADVCHSDVSASADAGVLPKGAPKLSVWPGASGSMVSAPSVNTTEWRAQPVFDTWSHPHRRTKLTVNHPAKKTPNKTEKQEKDKETHKSKENNHHQPTKHHHHRRSWHGEHNRRPRTLNDPPRHVKQTSSPDLASSLPTAAAAATALPTPMPAP